MLTGPIAGTKIWRVLVTGGRCDENDGNNGTEIAVYCAETMLAKRGSPRFRMETRSRAGDIISFASFCLFVENVLGPNGRASRGRRRLIC